MVKETILVYFDAEGNETTPELAVRAVKTEYDPETGEVFSQETFQGD